MSAKPQKLRTKLTQTQLDAIYRDACSDITRALPIVLWMYAAKIETVADAVNIIKLVAQECANRKDPTDVLSYEERRRHRLVAHADGSATDPSFGQRYQDSVDNINGLLGVSYRTVCKHAGPNWCLTSSNAPGRLPDWWAPIIDMFTGDTPLEIVGDYVVALLALRTDGTRAAKEAKLAMGELKEVLDQCEVKRILWERWQMCMGEPEPERASP